MEASSLSSNTSKTLHLTQFRTTPNKLIIPIRKSFHIANYSKPEDHHDDHNHNHDHDQNREITQSLHKITKPIVLKMSFNKLKAPENPDKGRQTRNTTSLSSPSYDEWSEWERKLFARYYDDVFEAMELLRLYLTRTRPTVAVGLLALVAMAVPLMTPAVLSSALKMAKGMMEGCRVCIDIDFL